MRHLAGELSELRRRLLEMSGLVESSVYHSVQALVAQDAEQAAQVHSNEIRINRMELEIDEMATRLLALEAPVAADLRLITAAMKINTDLERMGDLAENIAKRAQSLMKQKLVKPAIDIPHMASLTENMVRTALDAFVRADVEMARTVLASDDAVDKVRNVIYDELIDYMQSDPSAVRQCVDMMFVARDLERIADHATNIAEDVVFVIEGVDVRHPAARAANF
ncbi:MAG: phosphate signaling complex protein PhoU [Acidobacteria bacterium]|nr:phosphate signaling complex protein PhoU [Acidobacteriota bacterium]